jgi:hypothetical protein
MMYCFNRAYISASATIGAYFGINFVDVAFGNSFYRTFINTSTASGAIIINFISHDLLGLCPGEAERVSNFHGKGKNFIEYRNMNFPQFGSDDRNIRAKHRLY